MKLPMEFHEKRNPQSNRVLIHLIKSLIKTKFKIFEIYYLQLIYFSLIYTLEG